MPEIPAVRGLSGGGLPAPKSLREMLRRGDRILLPGVPDALTARLAERAGFPACYVSGAGFANAQMALPDVGLVSREEIAATSVGSRSLAGSRWWPTATPASAGRSR
jgi:hypothetical protein